MTDADRLSLVQSYSGQKTNLALDVIEIDFIITILWVASNALCSITRTSVRRTKRFSLSLPRAAK